MSIATRPLSRIRQGVVWRPLRKPPHSRADEFVGLSSRDPRPPMATVFRHALGGRLIASGTMLGEVFGGVGFVVEWPTTFRLYRPNDLGYFVQEWSIDASRPETHRRGIPQILVPIGGELAWAVLPGQRPISVFFSTRGLVASTDSGECIQTPYDVSDEGRPIAP